MLIPQLQDSSIAGRLARLNVMVGGTALFLACAGFFIYDFYNFRSDVVAKLDMQAQIIGANSVSALVFDDPDSAERTLSALHGAPHIILAEIRTPDGRTFASYHRDHGVVWPPGQSIPSGEAQFHGFHNQQAFFGRLLTFEGKNIGSIYMLSDLDAFKRRERNFAALVGVVLLVSLGTAMWISSFTRRSIAEPIVQLSNVAAIVSKDKNYSVRALQPGNLRGDGTPDQAQVDEVSGLIATFNEMLEQIQTRDVALRNAHDELERRVEERTAQLHAANAELEAFSYSVSHDLRSPLRHISAFSSIMSEEFGASLEPGARQYLQRIQERAKKMSELIEGLLSMAQIGRKELVRVPTNLNSLVRDVVSELHLECQDRQIEWRIAELPTMECESSLIKQVFVNLLSNAIKYSRRCEVATIEIGRLDEQDAVVFFVRDNGAGFDQRYADKLFGVFQRLHRPDEFEGTGVGLATVRRILQKHGGDVWATSELGKGATFFFTLSAFSPAVYKQKAMATAV